MSRKCPKRNHLFINWLKANCSRFPFQLRIIRKGKRKIDFDFHGITSVLKFSVEYTVTNGPWITVDAVWPGVEREGIVRFFGAEVITKSGWISLRELPDNRRHWKTKEELWEEICFEGFLSWCKNDLAEASWLEFYNIRDDSSGAYLHKDDPINNSYLENIKREFELDGMTLPAGVNFFILVRSDLGEDI
jgi:hypothetical protein